MKKTAYILLVIITVMLANCKEDTLMVENPLDINTTGQSQYTIISRSNVGGVDKLQIKYQDGILRFEFQNQQHSIEFISSANSLKIYVNLTTFSLKLVDKMGIYDLMLPKMYAKKAQYLNAKKPFLKEEKMVKDMLRIYSDLLVKAGLQEFQIPDTSPMPVLIQPNFITPPCAEGTTYVLGTSYSSTRSLAASAAFDYLIDECNNQSCIGCVKIIGTDCACLFDDYICECTARGCACN